jgi:ABC-type nitrate/sulfonate/bicarbonate transport system permease component
VNVGVLLKPPKILALSLVGGIGVTLLTGLLENTPEMLVGAAWYGYPLAWLVRRIIAPEYFPYVVRPLRLLVDIAFWAIIAGIILFANTKIRKK